MGIAPSTKSMRLPSAVDLIYLTILVLLLCGAAEYLAGTLRAGKMFAWVDATSYSFSDFVHFYQCGQLTLSADHNRVYDPGVQLEWFNRLFTNYRWSQPHFIQYVPFVFPLCVPLTLLPMAQSFVVWAALSLAGGLIALYLLCRRAGQLSRLTAAAIMLGATASWPSALTIRIGQQSWLLTALFALYCLSWLRRRDITAGIMLALTSFKPHYTLFLAVPALAGGRFRLLAAAAATEAALLALAGLTIGWQNVLSYPSIVMHADASRSFLGVHPEKMVCIRGLLDALLPHESVLPASLAVMCLALAAAAVGWRKAVGQDARRARLGLALIILSALFFSPHTHFYDYLVLGVAAALTLRSASAPALARERPWPRASWGLLLYLYPAFTWVSQMWGGFFPQLAFNPYLVADAYHAALLTAGALWLAGLQPDKDAG